jgi:hypothetical protein
MGPLSVSESHVRAFATAVCHVGLSFNQELTFCAGPCHVQCRGIQRSCGCGLQERQAAAAPPPPL